MGTETSREVPRAFSPALLPALSATEFGFSAIKLGHGGFTKKDGHPTLAHERDDPRLHILVEAEAGQRRCLHRRAAHVAALIGIGNLSQTTLQDDIVYVDIPPYKRYRF